MEPKRDPRSFVTPDAFSVSKDLVGLPLARPRTRLAAILVDGVIIAVVSQLGWTVLGLFAAFYFFRMATRRSAGNVLTRAAQYSMGCAGAFVLGLTVIVATGFLQDLLSAPSVGSTVNVQVAGVRVPARAMGTAFALQGAETEAEAFAAASELARVVALDGAADADDVEDMLDDLVPEDVRYDRLALIDRVVEATFPSAPAPLTAAGPAVSNSAILQLPLEDALTQYADLVRRASSAELGDEEASLRRDLERRIAAELAGDTVSALLARLEALGADVEAERERARQARLDAEAASERRGLFAWIIDSADELGLGFGWGALYFSTILAWTNGLTPGKRLFGLRVVRLNGEPMSWLMAFERSGGYAAGFATGLLGFAHMLWDPNRMGIHDKIAETVVIKDKGLRVPGPQGSAGHPVNTRSRQSGP